MNSRTIARVIFFCFVLVLLVSCNTDYSSTGRGLLYLAGIIAGIAVDRTIAGLNSGDESLGGILCGFITVGLFALVATYVPDDIAKSLGIIATIIGTIAIIAIMVDNSRD